jgi:anti-sigma28 factor (negative regulator of flagellin synthesis)
MIRKIETSSLFKVDTTSKDSKKVNTKKLEKLSKVEEIKKAIENGTYKIDIESSARAMAKALL